MNNSYDAADTNRTATLPSTSHQENVPPSNSAHTQIANLRFINQFTEPASRYSHAPNASLTFATSTSRRQMQSRTLTELNETDIDVPQSRAKKTRLSNVSKIIYLCNLLS